MSFEIFNIPSSKGAHELNVKNYEFVFVNAVRSCMNQYSHSAQVLPTWPRSKGAESAYLVCLSLNSAILLL